MNTSTENMIEDGIRKKLRFGQGGWMMEDLYDLNLDSRHTRSSLDQIAKDLNKQIKETGEESFVNTNKNKASEELLLKFEIVKHIISVRLAEQEAAKNAQDIKAQKEELLSLIKDAEMSEKKSMSKEELLASLASLES